MTTIIITYSIFEIDPDRTITIINKTKRNEQDDDIFTSIVLLHLFLFY